LKHPANMTTISVSVMSFELDCTDFFASCYVTKFIFITVQQLNHNKSIRNRITQLFSFLLLRQT
jgi:hypothetical protein